MAMMVIVDYFMIRTLGQRAKVKGFLWRNGPMLLLFLATPLVLAEPTRHVMGDTGFWLWCGDNGDYPRVNQTWNPICDRSSTEYQCDTPCCIPQAEMLTIWPNDANNKSTVPYTKLANSFEDGTKAGIDAAYLVENNHQFPQIVLDDPKWKGAFAVTNATTGKITGYECSCQCTLSETMGNLSSIGWLFTFSMTYIGFALLAVGSLWNANIIQKCKKMKKRYRQLRGLNSDGTPRVPSDGSNGSLPA